MSFLLLNDDYATENFFLQQLAVNGPLIQLGNILCMYGGQKITAAVCSLQQCLGILLLCDLIQNDDLG